jgi:hypothetical protein
MDENPYTSPLPSASRPTDKPRNAVAFWLAVMGGLWVIPWGLIVYGLCVSSPSQRPEIAFQIEFVVFPFLLAALPIWIAARVRQGRGIKATRYLLFAMIPFVAGEMTAPIFAFFKLDSIPTGSYVFFFFVVFLYLAHALCYLSAWRWLIRLRKVTATLQPSAASRT